MDSLRFTPMVIARNFLSLFLLVMLAAPAVAQTWPQRPVKFIVTLGPGSGVDLGSRLIAERLSQRWGQPVVIENRPGGDAIVAVTTFLSANDDHILLATPVSSLTAHRYMLPSVPYKDSDLLPVARMSNTIIVIAVPASLDVKSIQDLANMAKAQPGKLNWAGTTGAIDFLFAGFLKKHNLNMVRVPYRNPQDASTDLSTGRIQVAEASLATLRPQVQAGKIKMLAVTNSVRAPSNPDIPTVKEAGFSELTLDGFVGLFGPQGMSAELREKIAADVRTALSDPMIIDRLTTSGQFSNFGGPADFAAAIKEQRDSLAITAKDLGITPSL